MKGIQKNLNEILFKIIVIGESGTGKSCLMIRYVKESFTPEYNVTVGNLRAIKEYNLDLDQLKSMIIAL